MRKCWGDNGYAHYRDCSGGFTGKYIRQHPSIVHLNTYSSLYANNDLTKAYKKKKPLDYNQTEFGITHLL